MVIGVGVKKSTSDLLIANCDEFIYYDDLVREAERCAARAAKRLPRPGEGQRQERGEGGTEAPVEGKSESKSDEEKRQAALDLVLETIQALFEERGDEEKVWGSMVKQALKRRKPGFNETYHGFRTFGSCSKRPRSASCCGSSSTRSRAATSSAASRLRSEGATLRAAALWLLCAAVPVAMAASAADRVTIDANGHRILAEVADTPDARDLGLMFRTPCRPITACLFVYPNDARHCM